MSLINILASGIHDPAGVLDIVNWSEHMAKGVIKYAPYIANLFIPYFEKMDPTKELIDLVYFDGASNV